MRTDQMVTTGGEEPVLAVSLELPAAKWKVALHHALREQPAVHTVAQRRPQPSLGRCWTGSNSKS
jgi:transposase